LTPWVTRQELQNTKKIEGGFLLLKILEKSDEILVKLLQINFVGLKNELVKIP